MTVEDPVPFPLGHPAQGQRGARVHEMRHLEGPLVAAEDLLGPPVTPAVDVEKNPCRCIGCDAIVGLITRHRTVLPRV